MSDGGDSDFEQPSCPLCMEDLDATDKNFHPCPCGYQICAWCWHQRTCPGTRVMPARSPTATADERMHSSVDGCEVLMGGCGASLVATSLQRALTQGSRLGFLDLCGIVDGRRRPGRLQGTCIVGTVCGDVPRPSVG